MLSVRSSFPVALAIACGTSGLFAQETIVSDRPGIGSGSFVLGSGAVQIESGLSLSEGGSARDYRIGHVLVRVGAGPVELQAILNSFVLSRSGALDDDGLEDMGIGIKAPLYRSADGVTALSVLATVALPSGSAFLTSDEVIPAATLLLDYAASDRIGLAVNVGASAGVGQADDVVSVILTSSVPLGSGVGAYLGYAGFFAAGTGQHFAEGGLTLLANPGMQLDLNGGVDVETGDYFIGAGVAVRVISVR